MSLSSGAKRRESHASGNSRWSVIWLMYVREMRDQLRDRRTLFTIAVLPILLYPLVGTLLLQIAQFSRQHPTSVCVVGSDHLIRSSTAAGKRVVRRRAHRQQRSLRVTEPAVGRHRKRVRC